MVLINYCTDTYLSISLFDSLCNALPNHCLTTKPITISCLSFTSHTSFTLQHYLLINLRWRITTDSKRYIIPPDRNLSDFPYWPSPSAFETLVPVDRVTWLGWRRQAHKTLVVHLLTCLTIILSLFRHIRCSLQGQRLAHRRNRRAQENPIGGRRRRRAEHCDSRDQSFERDEWRKHREVRLPHPLGPSFSSIQSRPLDGVRTRQWP